LGLGCDDSASNDGSSLLDSIRMAYLMQTFNSKNRGGSPSSYEMLKIATVRGAAMMGRDDIGSLEPQKGADLFLIDAARLEFCGALHDPTNLIAKTGATGPVYLTMVNGKIIYRDGIITGVDEKQLATEAENTCTRVIREQSSIYKGSN